jgi:GNAT superfamily N-acetyltransferase
MEITYTIKPINNEYCDRIVNLILPIQLIEFNVPVTLEAQPDLLDIDTYYHQQGGSFWGAVVKEELIGTIALLDMEHNAVAIRKMFVKKEYRGKELGIAQQLLNTLISNCRERDKTDLYLGTVPQLKAAHRFYERNGFVSISSEDLPDYFPRMAADNMFYHLHLK